MLFFWRELWRDFGVIGSKKFPIGAEKTELIFLKRLYNRLKFLKLSDCGRKTRNY
jgi:hypothetical protein